MKYIVSINIGTRLWTHRSFDFELGRYRWLWRAKLAAWWHVQVYPFREATVISVEPGNSVFSHPPATETPDGL